MKNNKNNHKFKPVFNPIFLFRKIFNKNNISKIIIIFIVGFISRIFINYFYNVNVFRDFLHPFSIGYYFFFASFVVFINELFSTFNLSILPGFVRLFASIPRFSSLLSSLSFFKFEYFKLSSCAKARHFSKYLYSSASFGKARYSYHTITDAMTSCEAQKQDKILNDVQHTLGDSLVLRKNFGFYSSNISNNTSSGNTSNSTSSSNYSPAASQGGSFNSLLSNEPVDRLLPKEDVNRLRESTAIRRRDALNRSKESGISKGEMARFRSEERLASAQR